MEVGGGGSIEEWVAAGFDDRIESGNGAMASSEDEVSMVILTVGLVVGRSV